MTATLIEPQHTPSTKANAPETTSAPKGLPRGGLTWFELPTTSLARAVDFYRVVLGAPLIHVGGEQPMFMFPRFGGEVTGALVRRPGCSPSPGGALVYLRVAGTLADAMSRVAAAGGSLQTGAMTVPGVAGTFCVIEDSEGNRVGLHAEL